MSLVGVPPGNRKIMLPIKFEFLLDNLKWLSGDFAEDRPVEDIVWDFVDISRQEVGGDGLRDTREGGLVVRPAESSHECFFASHREIIISDTFVISKVGNFRIEKFSPLSRLFHMLDDFRD